MVHVTSCCLRVVAGFRSLHLSTDGLLDSGNCCSYHILSSCCGKSNVEHKYGAFTTTAPCSNQTGFKYFFSKAQSAGHHLTQVFSWRCCVNAGTKPVGGRGPVLPSSCGCSGSCNFGGALACSVKVSACFLTNMRTLTFAFHSFGLLDCGILPSLQSRPHMAVY